MITIFRPRFRSRDAAFAAATKLTHLVPGHDYDAWPDRGYWVLVMRYRDDDGHIRCKFAERDDLFSKKHNIQEKPAPRKMNQAFPGQRSRHVINPERGLTPSAALANPSRA